jgi:hypothetical protein
MIIIFGLVILVAALVVAVVGIMANRGSAHAVGHFSVLGYHVTGSAGTLFLAGIVVGAAGLLGLSLLLAGARRRRRHGSPATRRLRQSRRETAAASQERDDLIVQRDAARTYPANSLRTGTSPPDVPPSPSGNRWSRLRDLRNRLAPAQAAAHSDSSSSRRPPDLPASSRDVSVTAISPADGPADPFGPDGAVTSPALEAHAAASAAAE